MKRTYDLVKYCTNSEGDTAVCLRFVTPLCLWTMTDYAAARCSTGSFLLLIFFWWIKQRYRAMVKSSQNLTHRLYRVSSKTEQFFQIPIQGCFFWLRCALRAESTVWLSLETFSRVHTQEWTVVKLNWSGYNSCRVKQKIFILTFWWYSKRLILK